MFLMDETCYPWGHMSMYDMQYSTTFLRSESEAFQKANVDIRKDRMMGLLRR